MATVYGCVIWPTTITFDNIQALEGCLIESAEIICSGEHINQVALTLSSATNPDCNDTFYGCVNWSTGKFQVIIPDNCCTEYGVDCGCFSPGETPKHFEVIFSGIEDCLEENCSPNSLGSTVNGPHILTQDDADSCKYVRHIDNSYYIALNLYAYSGGYYITALTARTCYVFTEPEIYHSHIYAFSCAASPCTIEGECDGVQTICYTPLCGKNGHAVWYPID